MSQPVAEARVLIAQIEASLAVTDKQDTFSVWVPYEKTSMTPRAYLRFVQGLFR